MSLKGIPGGKGGGESDGRFAGLQGLCTMHLAAAILVESDKASENGWL